MAARSDGRGAERAASRLTLAMFADENARALGFPDARTRARADGGDSRAEEAFARLAKVETMEDARAAKRFLFLRSFGLVLKNGDDAPDSPMFRFVNSKGCLRRMLRFVEIDVPGVVHRYFGNEGTMLNLQCVPLGGGFDRCLRGTMLPLVAHGDKTCGFRSCTRRIDSRWYSWLHMCKPSAGHHREGEHSWLHGELPISSDAPHLVIEFSCIVIRCNWQQHHLGHAESLFSFGPTNNGTEMTMLKFGHPTLEFGKEYSIHIESTRFCR